MKARKNLILIIASTGVFFEALDIAIVNLAMPLIQQDFQLANDEIQWMQTLYILLYGGFLIVGGRLADTIGRRKTFVIGNVIFLATSLGAAVSFRYDMLVAFRAVQGIGAALMMPSALSIITNTFDNGTERAKAIGIFGAFAAIGSGSGMSRTECKAAGGPSAIFQTPGPPAAPASVLTVPEEVIRRTVLLSESAT